MAKKIKQLEHVAIIMDGNGRWAQKHGLKHLDGHRQGAEAVKKVIEACGINGIKYLTLYAFSTENWKRSKFEVNGLMRLLESFLTDNLSTLHEKNIALKAIGRLDKLPFFVRRKLFKAIDETADNESGTVILALNYGGRAEIVDAAKKIAEEAISGKISPDDIDENRFAEYLYAPDIPPPDLMIRTSGEMRLSNFMLWELAYSEFFVTDTLWPDFGPDELAEAVESYYKRERRFGGRTGDR
jgi:undecaprenyl diphosphate synthase